MNYINKNNDYVGKNFLNIEELKSDKKIAAIRFNSYDKEKKKFSTESFSASKNNYPDRLVMSIIFEKNIIKSTAEFKLSACSISKLCNDENYFSAKDLVVKTLEESVSSLQLFMYENNDKLDKNRIVVVKETKKNIEYFSIYDKEKLQFTYFNFKDGIPACCGFIRFNETERKTVEQDFDGFIGQRYFMRNMKIFYITDENRFRNTVDRFITDYNEKLATLFQLFK